MKFTISEIRNLQPVLQFTGEIDTDEKPVRRTFSGTQISAYKWFVKNTEKAADAYNKWITEKKEALEKKHKKEIEEEKEAFKKLSAYMSKMDENKAGDKRVLELASKALAARSVQVQIQQELEADKEVQKKFAEDLHDIEVRKEAKELIKECLGDFQYQSTDVWAADLIEKFNG